MELMQPFKFRAALPSLIQKEKKNQKSAAYTAATAMQKEYKRLFSQFLCSRPLEAQQKLPNKIKAKLEEEKKKGKKKEKEGGR